MVMGPADKLTRYRLNIVMRFLKAVEK